jgi:large subunit ribosomal protein L15
MDLSNLKPAKGSIKKSKRIGRGQGSGKGGTSTRGHKGAQSRSGYSKKLGYEGGQMSLVRRVPKWGFTNFNRKEYKGINLDIIQRIADKEGVTVITPEVLVKSGYTSKNDRIKILGRGELKAKMEITAHGFSATAKKTIEELGGTANII